MQLDDIQYAVDTHNQPGRSPWIQYRDMPYDSGSIAAGGADISIDLPRPAVGFVRKWQHLAVIPSVLARTDVIRFTRVSADQTTGTVLWTLADQDNFAGTFDSFPVINGTYWRSGVTDGVYAGIIGMPPFIVPPEDILRVFWDMSAPVAQTISVRGWYKDLPV